MLYPNHTAFRVFCAGECVAVLWVINGNIPQETGEKVKTIETEDVVLLFEMSCSSSHLMHESLSL